MFHIWPRCDLLAACDETSTSRLRWSRSDVALKPLLDERARRWWAASESRAIGFGGDALVSAATGLARQTIRGGRQEVEAGLVATGRIRRPGAGRPTLEAKQPGLAIALEQLVEPLTRGDPTSPLRWTCKSRANSDGGVGQARLGGQFDHRGSPAARVGLPPAVGPQEPRGDVAPRPQCAIRAHQRHGGHVSRATATGDLGGYQEEGIGRRLQECRPGMAAVRDAGRRPRP